MTLVRNSPLIGIVMGAMSSDTVAQSGADEEPFARRSRVGPMARPVAASGGQSHDSPPVRSRSDTRNSLPRGDSKWMPSIRLLLE